MEINKNRLTSSGDKEYATGSAASDEKMMPQDMEAFFKHPLVAANQGDNGDALALLHEYQTLYSGHAVRSENSPIQIFDTNFDPKVSTSSGFDPHLNTAFKPQTVEKGFYKNEPSGNSISDSLSQPNKGAITDPTLPSINILSRSTFPQNPYTPPTTTKCLNSQNAFHSMHNPTTDWRNNVSTKSDLLKSNDMMFKISNDPLTESGDSYNKLKSENSLTICNRANDLKLNKVPVLSMPNKDIETTTAHSNHIAITNIPPQLNQPAFLHQANSVESSAIDMSFQSNAQNLKMANNTSSKFLTSKQFFGDSDLIQMLEKQMPPEQFAQSISMSLNSKNSLKSHPNIPSLPFPLPEVPLGYRLVITHLPITNDQEPDSKHITQLIIDNPIVPQATSVIPEVPLKQTNLTTAGKSRNLENDAFPRKYITSHDPSVRVIENIDANGRLSSIPKENILTKSLEEANLLPLLTNPPNESLRAETQDFSLNSPLELPSLQNELNLPSWQTAVQSPKASSPATIPEVPCSPPQKKPSYKGRPNTRWNHITCIPKIDPDNSGFKFYLEAAISTNPKKNEDRVTYLNKSQYYGLVLQHNPVIPEISSLSQTLRSVVMLVFRERLSVAEEMRAWECWYSRQHSYKQRVLDVDSKNSGVSDGFSKPIVIEEVAHNAASITWNKHTSVKLNLALNCLSTDFSHQKGIRGNPLHIQIDTYEGDSPQLSHRAYCQIKVFCDKGADRKVREEEKKRSKNSEDHEHQEPCDQSYFYSMVDITTPPVLFSPSASTQFQDAKSPKVTLATKRQSIDILDGQSESKKRSKNDKLLLFVREERNTVFNALVVQQPTVQCLSRAIQEKFLNSSVNVENIYKESKFMKVKVDDVIVSCMADESTFTISFHYHPESSTESLTSCDVILTEIRVQNDFG